MSKIRNKEHAIRVCSRILGMYCDAHVIIGRGRHDDAAGSSDDTYENSMDIGGDPILCREIAKMGAYQLRLVTGELDDEYDDEAEVEADDDDSESEA